jgi:hypothetical protein
MCFIEILQKERRFPTGLKPNKNNSVHQSLRDFVFSITTKLCGANEAQRSLRPNERLVMH